MENTGIIPCLFDCLAFIALLLVVNYDGDVRGL